MKVEKFTPVPEQRYKLELSKREVDDLRIALYWAKKDDSGTWAEEKARMATLHKAFSAVT